MSPIGILWLRQVKKYFRSPSRIIGSLAQPLLYLLSFGFGFGSVFAQAGNGSYIQFLTPGIIAMTVLFSAVFSGIELIWDKQFGFLKETMVAPVSRFEIMLGRTLGGATVASLQGVIVLILTIFIGFKPYSWLLVPAGLGVIFLIGLLFTSLGTIIGSKLDDMQGFQLIMNFLVMPIFFLSGALFPLDNLPSVMEIITRLDPLSYGVDALRGVLIGVYSLPLLIDVVVLFGTSFGLLLLGSYFFKKIQA